MRRRAIVGGLWLLLHAGIVFAGESVVVTPLELPRFQATTPLDRQAVAGLSDILRYHLGAMDAGDPHKLIAQLDHALQIYPDAASLQYQLALQNTRIENWPAAVQAATRAVQLDTTHVAAHLLLARLLMSTGKEDQAIALLENARQRMPHAVDLHTTLARLYLLHDAYAQAERVLRDYLRIDPDAVEVLYYLGTLYAVHLQQPTQAVHMFRRVIALQPQHQYAWQALSQVYLDQGNIRGALAVYLLIEKYAAGDPAIELRIAVLHYAQKEYGEAIARLEKVLATHPAEEKTRYYLAVMHEEAGHFPLAQKNYEQISAASEFYKDAQLRMAVYYYRAGEITRSQRGLTEAIHRSPKTEEFYEYLAFLYQQDKAHESAIHVLKKAIHQFPDRPRFYYSLGLLFDGQTKRRDAVRMMRRVIDLQPTNWWALNYVGYMYAQWNTHVAEAEDFVTQALKLRPQDGHIQDSMGLVRLRQEKYAEALSYFERADKLTPNEPAILRHRAEAMIQLGHAAQATPLLDRALTLAQHQSPVDAEELQAISEVRDAL